MRNNININDSEASRPPKRMRWLDSEERSWCLESTFSRRERCQTEDPFKHSRTALALFLFNQLLGLGGFCSGALCMFGDQQHFGYKAKGTLYSGGRFAQKMQVYEMSWYSWHADVFYGGNG